MFLIICATLVVSVHSHGRLLEPPGRSSLHRFKTTDPALIPFADIIQPNYSDNQLFCGGRQTQINNGGKCGVCGDDYNAEVKENEAGGKYALGIITRKYEANQVIDATVEITAAHKGFFEFRLCPWDNPDVAVTHECLNRYLLSFADGQTRWYLPSASSGAVGTHRFKLQLPENVVCEQCVLQWRYRTGNSWGVDGFGAGLGHGPQEEFYGCSDIGIRSSSITSSMTSSEPVRPSSASTTKSPTQSTSTTVASSKQPVVTPTTTRPHPVLSSQAPDIDCGRVELNKPVFRDCTSFYLCAHEFQEPWIFACPPGTVFDIASGRCDHTYNVAYPCGSY